MKRLLLFFCALLTLGVSGAWAETGTITLTKSDIEFLRNHDNNTLDVNNTGRNATRFASIISPLIALDNGGGNINVSDFKIHSTRTNTIQMLAGYTIDSYSITVTPAKATTFSVSGGTADKSSLSASEEVTINVTGVNANSCTFTFAGNPTADYNTISQIVVNYSYTTAPTMVQTMANLSYANYASCPTYTITCERSALYVDENGTNLTTAHAVASPTEARKKFAFIKNTLTGKYYLYSVTERKFVNKDKSLANSPTDAVELHFTNNFSYPQYVRVGTNYMNVQESGGTSGGIVMNSYVRQDGGNCFIIEPAGTADLTRAHKIVNGWTATYHIDGTSFTATADLTYNATLTLPNTLKRAYCSYKFYSDAECENEITTANDVYDDIYVKYNYTGPFAFSTEGVSPEYVYYLLRTYGDNYLYSNGSSIGITTTQNTADAYQWAIVGNPYSYTIKNKSTGTYLVASLSNNGEATLGATGTSFGLYTNTQAPVTNHFTAVTTNGNNLVIPQRHPNAGTGIRCYNGTGARFTDVTGLNNLAGAYFIPFAVVTYNLIWNESTIQSTTKGSIIGTASDDEKPWTVPAYSSFAYDVTTIGKTTSEVNVTMSWDGPFDISSDYASAVWYYVSIAGKWLKYRSESGSYPLTDDIEKNDNGLWAFIGNPVDGFLIVSKGKGELSNLAWYIPPYSGDPSSDPCDKKWKVEEGEDGAEFQYGSYYLYNNSNALGLSNSAETASRTFVFRSYYCQQALDDLAGYASDNAVGQYFGVRQDNIDYVQSVFEGMSKMTAAEYTTYAVPSGIIGFLNIKYPTTGYYRIKNNSTGNYLAYGTPTTSESVARPTGLIATSNSTDAASVIQLTGSKGTYKLSTEGLNIQGQTGANIAFPGSDGTGVDFVFNISNPGIVSITNAASAVAETSRDGSLHEASEDWGVHGVVNWDASAANSKWVVEDATEVTLSLNAVGDVTYGTTYLPFGVTLPAESDVCAYTLQNLGNGWARPLILGDDGKSIPAGTPVLLKGTYSTSVTATIENVAAIELDETNLLSGTYTSIAHGDNLVLGKYDGTVGFYKYNFDIKPNKAYIAAAAEVKGFMLSWDDFTTSIEDNVGYTESQTPTIYNISGQRVSQPTRGIYIVNGKKMVIK